VPTMQSDREYVVPLAGVVIKAKTRANVESEDFITSDGSERWKPELKAGRCGPISSEKMLRAKPKVF